MITINASFSSISVHQHTPKDQRRSIDQTKKASDTLYELRKSTPTSPHSPTTSSKMASNQRLSSSSSSSSQRGAGNGGGRTRPILPPPPPPSAKDNSNQSSNPSQSSPYQSVEDLPLPPPPLDFLSAAPFDLPPPLPSPPVNRFPDDAPPLPPTTPPPPPPGFETEDEDGDEVVLPNPSSFPLAPTIRAPMSNMSTFKPQVSQVAFFHFVED